MIQPRRIFVGTLLWFVLPWPLSSQVAAPPVRVGFRNDLSVPILLRDLTQPLAPPIRLVPKETVWDRLPANARIPIAISDAASGQVLAKTILTVPPAGSVLFSIQLNPAGNVVLTPRLAP
ncbi:hypothetical protein HRbin36_00191 [bacterium HR36]|nr:hypothetical protein HRbin36_00191 [bacterium HR36]